MLRALPEKVRAAFVMSQIRRLEIVTELAVSERMVKKYMARAMPHSTA